MTRQRSVLVVDDDDSVRQVITVLLGREGLEVVGAEDGKAALIALAKREFDLHLIDIWMPKLNGVELLRKLQGRGEVVMMSGHATDATRDKVRALGALDFIEKPLEPEKILEVVRKALASDRMVRIRQETKRRVRSPAAAPAVKAPPAPSAPAPIPAAPNGRRILVADDDDSLRSLMAKVLSSKGYQVVTAADGQEAYEKAVCDPIDLVVMDINMPRVNGVEAVRMLRAYDPHLFILVVTGEATQDEQTQILRNGGAIILHKPFDVRQFVQRVEGLDFIAQKEKREQQHSKELEAQWRNRPFTRRMGDWWREKRAAHPKATVYVAVVFVALIISQLAVQVDGCVNDKPLIPPQADIEYWLERLSSGVEADFGR